MTTLKRSRVLIRSSMVLGVISALALLTQYGALCDIAKTAAPVWEWYVVGVCMIVMTVFVIVSLVTLGYVLRQTLSG